MADEREKQRPLRNLLDSVYEVHRNDIKSYASGHLNPSKLLKEDQARHKRWESSTKPPIRLKPKSELVNLPTRSGKTEEELRSERMREMLIEFSLGPVGSTVGVLTHPSVEKETPKFQQTTTKPVMVEELRLPDIRIPVADKGKQDKESGYKSAFVESYLGQSTKADQFASFKSFGEKVMNLSDAHDRGVLTGEKTVRELERKLGKKLAMLDASSQKGPNFHKLQIFTDVWEDIINKSDTFGDVLQKIKDEYDNYMAYLLDAQRPSQHRMLYHHLDNLTKDQADTEELKKEQERVKGLEREAKQLLEENTKLREVLKQEERLAVEALENSSKEKESKAYIRMEEVPKDLEEQVKDLHSKILSQLDAIEGFKKYQRENCVPISVCQHMEQCIKETEVDIQKLLKQNEFLEKSIEELEAELEDLLEKSGSDQSEARKLWRRINTMKVIKMGRERVKRGKKKARQGATEDT